MKRKLRFIRYILFFISLIIFVFALQIFVKNFSIENKIKQLKTRQYNLSGETCWLKNYYKPFLKTSYAKIIFSHAVGIPLKGEKIIKIINIKQQKKIDKEKEKMYNNTARISNFSLCKEFLYSLYKKYLSF